MASTRELVKRRKAIRNIRKITRTMELIATAQFKKALDRATQAEELANRYIADFGSGAIDRVDVAYMKFLNPARQQAVVETLLPLSSVPGAGQAAGGPKQEYEYLPDAAGILEVILPVSFKVRL